MRSGLMCVMAGALCLLSAGSAAAQEALGPASRVQATRSELESQVRSLEDMTLAQTASESQRAWARDQLTVARARLAEGDFRAGDRIAVSVAGDPEDRAAAAGSGRSLEQQLSDTFTVSVAQELSLPVLGVVALRGVLRSELDAHLTREVARVIREPVVSVQALIRVSVLGAVANPGYYTLPIDAMLTDALMIAGGPASGAKLKKMRIERNGQPVWRGDALQRAIAEGRTLIEMNLRGGDQLVIPEPRGGTESAIRTIAALVSIPIAIYSLSR